MIMPTKIIQPVDSLISVSSFVLDILKSEAMSLDDLLDKLNERYYKKISIEKLILCIDFLYIINKIESENETITINIR
ncbi:ABC-three component system middle component 6 [Aliarcobacter butzleri]|uniref:ABC-three component system middle component 6 n=1 Tax=Aliarcobacter butzleri TaxID=28197 RepID=UPI003B224CE2